MPVISVNSPAYFCRSSPRGPLIRLASIVVPAYFFHCGSAAHEGNPERPSAPPAAVPARRARRETKLSFIVRSPWRSASSHGILAPARPLQQPDYDDTQLLRFRQAPSGHPTTYHWKVAERMLEVAWTSAEAEDMAAQAFKI